MEAFFRVGLRVFCDHGGHIAQKGQRVKILFHRNGAMVRVLAPIHFGMGLAKMN